MNSTSQNPGREFSGGFGQNLTLGVSRGRWLGLPNPLDPFGVMISSTVKDLVEERDAADRAIQGLKLSRIRSETFGSLSYPPLEVCALLAQQCRLFILLLGGRYGSIIESQGISVVDFEYRVAREQNPRKILAFVKEPVEREPRQKEFLQRVQLFEHGYFTSKFATPEELYEGIQRDVSRWLTSHVNPQKPKAQLATYKQQDSQPAGRVPNIRSCTLLEGSVNNRRIVHIRPFRTFLLTLQVAGGSFGRSTIF